MERLGWAVAGAGAMLLAAEILLRLLPTPTATLIGAYVDRHVTTYRPGLQFRTATGWALLNAQTHRANAHGFIPDRAFTPSSDAVALIGDSLIEQSMLPAEQRLASILQESRKGRSVFAMGLGGSSLFDYLERIRYARDRLGVRSFWVVIERSDIRQSRCDGGDYFDACLRDSQRIERKDKGARNPLRDLLARSALLQYFVGTLRFSPERFLAIFGKSVPRAGADVSRAPAVLSAADSAVIERFLTELRLETRGSVGLILDPEIGDLRRGEGFGDPALAQLYRRAAEGGIAVVHPRRALAQYAQATGLDMRVGPYDSHWNARANCVIAQTILDSLPVDRDSPRTLAPICAAFAQIRSSTSVVSSMIARHDSGSE